MQDQGKFRSPCHTQSCQIFVSFGMNIRLKHSKIHNACKKHYQIFGKWHLKKNCSLIFLVLTRLERIQSSESDLKKNIVDPGLVGGDEK